MPTCYLATSLPNFLAFPDGHSASDFQPLRSNAPLIHPHPLYAAANQRPL